MTVRFRQDCLHGPMMYIDNDMSMGRSLRETGKALEYQIDLMLQFPLHVSFVPKQGYYDLLIHLL